MNKKTILKISIILLFITTIFFIINYGRYLICETWSLKQNGDTYYLTQSLHNYRLSKMSTGLIPKEVSSELVTSPDRIMNLQARATNVTFTFWIILLIQIIVIIILIFNLKTLKNTNTNVNK